MRSLIQRVKTAEVHIEGVLVGSIGEGLLVFICAMDGDTDKQTITMANKILKLRIFEDEQGKMNKSIIDERGSVLVVSQFTLAADTTRGNRPGFSSAARSDEGKRLYDLFITELEIRKIHFETGKFGAAMQVSLVNDGPVTIWLDTNSN